MSASHESVEVVYTGDTVMSALVSQPLVWRARLLIMEVTYLDGDGAAAAKNHHIHIQVITGLDKKMLRPTLVCFLSWRVFVWVMIPTW